MTSGAVRVDVAERASAGPLTVETEQRSVAATMRWVVVVSIAMFGACSSSRKADPPAPSGPASESVPAAGATQGNPPAKASAMQTFRVTPVGDTAQLSVEMMVPSGWTVDTSSPDGPTFQIPGAEIRQLTINALTLGGDPEARMAKAIRMQYEDGADARRSELSDGRVWMVRRESAVDHARMFVPYDGGVIMGVAILTHASADRLPAIQQAFETIAVSATR
jgi:hypothetical protein